MKLKNDFYQVKSYEIKEDELESIVSLNGNHPIFCAHFPGNPITPGVLLLHIASELLEEYICKKMCLDTAVSIKFRKPVLPSMEPNYIFRKINVIDDKLRVNVSIEVEGEQYVKMSLIYGLMK